MSNTQEPQYPLGRAFERSRDEAEAWRQRVIAILTPEQRQQHEKLQQDHAAQIETKRAELNSGQRDRIVQKMRDRFTREFAPAPRPGGPAKTNPALMRRLHDATPHYVDGKKTKETLALAGALRTAFVICREADKIEQQTAINTLQAEQRDRHDRFLNDCDREHKAQTRACAQELNEIAPRDANEKSVALDATRTAAPDKSWRDALAKAARHEAEQRRDHDLTRDFNR